MREFARRKDIRQMINKEPIRHHYIPQFILRNFCFNNRDDLLYFDKETSRTSVKNTRAVFMARNLYRDELNSPDEPTKIEKDMARFENEASQIITGRFLDKDELSITLEEDEKLKLFFAIMSFRSKITSNKFGAEASDENKAFYSRYQKDGNLADFWKRNLGNLVNCRSLKEVWDHNGIDDPIKVFFQRDTLGYWGLYFVVVERRGPIDFIISDADPAETQPFRGCTQRLLNNSRLAGFEYPQIKAAFLRKLCLYGSPGPPLLPGIRK